MQLLPPAPSADVHSQGWGCYDNTTADGEDVGSGRETYITIIIFGGGGLHEVAVGCCAERDRESPGGLGCAAKTSSSPLNIPEFM